MRHLKYAAAFAMACCMLCACNDTDIDIFDSPVVDASVSGSESGTTVSSLTFTWQAVDGCHQYGYKLLDPNGETVRQGLTTQPTVTFMRLAPSTTYTLDVEAYGANGVETKHFTLSATTADIVKLDAPRTDAMTLRQVSGNIVIEWPEVANAQYYGYVMTLADGTEPVEGTTEVNSVTFSGLPNGDYLLTIWANSDDEAFSVSDQVQYAFSRKREPVATKDCTYTSYVLGDIPATLTIYDDGAYAVSAFMGNEGYDLEFAINDDNSVAILNPYYESGVYRYVEASAADVLVIYQDAAYCYYDEDEEGKYIVFYCYYNDDTTGDYDYVTWDVPLQTITIDDLEGDYTVTKSMFNSYYWFDSPTMGSWTTFDNTITYEVNITKVDDTTVEIYNLLGTEVCPEYSTSTSYGYTYFNYYDFVYATVDLKNMTLTIDPQQLHDYDGEPCSYGKFTKVVDGAAVDEPVVGTFDTSLQIVISDFSVDFSGTLFLKDSYIELSKQ